MFKRALMIGAVIAALGVGLVRAQDDGNDAASDALRTAVLGGTIKGRYPGRLPERVPRPVIRPYAPAALALASASMPAP